MQCKKIKLRFGLVSAIENTYAVNIPKHVELKGLLCCTECKIFLSKKVHVRWNQDEHGPWKNKAGCSYVSFLSIFFVKCKASAPGYGKHFTPFTMDSVLPKGD